MANLNYDSFIKSLRTVLETRNNQDDAALSEVIEAAVRELIEEFDTEIGSRTDRCPEICNVELQDGCIATRIYLSDDVMYVKEAWINGVQITPVDILDEEMWNQAGSNYSYNVGYNAFIERTPDGCMYIQLTNAINIDPNCPPRVKVVYGVTSSDISYIPEAYKTLIIYGAVMHYHNWFLTDQIEAVSKATQNYDKYLKRMRAQFANQIVHQKRPYEVEWKKMFRFILEGSREDFYSRGYGTN